jgi:Ulp1 family protease
LPFNATTSPSITDGTAFNVVEITAPVRVEYTNQDFRVLCDMNKWVDDASIRLFPFLAFNMCGILSYHIFEPYFIGGGFQKLSTMNPGRKQGLMDYFDKKFVLLPYHKSKTHWVLFVLVKTGDTTRNLLCFDSLYDQETTDLDLGLCRSLLEDCFLKHSFGITVEDCFSLTKTRHQKDSHSCGVYLIRAAAAVAEHATLYNYVDDLSDFHDDFPFPTEFDPRPYRKKLVTTINGFLGKIVAPATSTTFQEGSLRITATNKFTPSLGDTEEQEETLFF